MAMFNSYVSLPEGNSHPPRWIYANIHLIYNAVIRSHLFLSVSRPIVLTFLGIAALFLIWDVTRKSRQATPKVVLEAVERPEAACNPGNHKLNWHGENGEDGGMLGVECWGLGNWDTFRVEELAFWQKLWSVIWSPQQSFLPFLWSTFELSGSSDILLLLLTLDSAVNVKITFRHKLESIQPPKKHQKNTKKPWLSWLLAGCSPFSIPIFLSKLWPKNKPPNPIHQG